MPVQKAGPDVRQNPIRFKILFVRLRSLNAMEIRHTEAVDFLKPAHELDTAEFWKTKTTDWQSLSPEVFLYYRLPIEFQELVVVSDQFHLKPLLYLINNDGRFYLLALAKMMLGSLREHATASRKWRWKICLRA